LPPSMSRRFALPVHDPWPSALIGGSKTSRTIATSPAPAATFAERLPQPRLALLRPPGAGQTGRGRPMSAYRYQ
jgi:hypothetical protein